jgi:hypothetical protein
VTPFVVLSLPRSRSFWVSRFLSYGGRRVAHDPSRFFTGPDDIAKYFRDPAAGAVDTALGLVWSGIPGVKVATIWRPVYEVESRLRALGRPQREQAIQRLDDKLSAIPAARFEFHSLGVEAEARRLFQYCLEQPFDRDWWLKFRGVTLECDRAEYEADVVRNIAGIQATYGRSASA